MRTLDSVADYIHLFFILLFTKLYIYIYIYSFVNNYFVAQSVILVKYRWYLA